MRLRIFDAKTTRLANPRPIDNLPRRISQEATIDGRRRPDIVTGVVQVVTCRSMRRPLPNT